MELDPANLKGLFSAIATVTSRVTAIERQLEKPMRCVEGAVVAERLAHLIAAHEALCADISGRRTEEARRSETMSQRVDTLENDVLGHEGRLQRFEEMRSLIEKLHEVALAHETRLSAVEQAQEQDLRKYLGKLSATALIVSALVSGIVGLISHWPW